MLMSRRVGIRWSTREDGPDAPSPPWVRRGRGAGVRSRPNERLLRAHVSSRSDPPSRQLPGAGAQRRLYAAVLLSAVACGRGRPRSRRCSSSGSTSSPITSARCTARAVALKLPSVIALRQYVRPNEYPAFTRFNLFLRDRFRCVYCGSAQGTDLRPCRPARPGRPHDVGECRHRLRAVQSAQGRAHAARRRTCTSHREPIRPTSWQLQEHGRASRPIISTRAGAIISTGTSNWSRRTTMSYV